MAAFEEIKKKLKKYDLEVDYETKIKLGNELMQEKYNNREKLIENIRKEHTRVLFEHPSKLAKFDNDDGFELTKQQQFLKRFLSPLTGNTGVLLFHATGKGKTCSSIQIAENFMNVLDEKIMIICSETIKQRFIDEIKGKGKNTGCMGDVILKRLAPGWESLSEKEIGDLLDTFIKDNFCFTTLKKLKNNFDKKINFTVKLDQLKVKLKNAQDKKNEQLEGRIKDQIIELSSALRKYMKDKFSNRVIIYDEVHGIRTDGNDDDEDDDEDDDDVEKQKAKKSEKQRALDFFNMVMRFAENVRLVLMTATPMYHDSSEIFSIMKLLMLNDKSVPAKRIDEIHALHQDTQPKKGGPLPKKVKDLLAYFSANFVSYGSVDKSSSDFPVVLSPFEAKNKFTNYRLTQSDRPEVFLNSKNEAVINEEYGSFIFKSYSSARQKNLLDPVEKGKKKLNHYAAKRLMNICYAENDTDIATNRWESFVKKTGTAKKNVLYEYKNDSNKLVGDSLNELAPKIYSIMKIVDQSSAKDGIIMIYSQFYGSGVYPVCAALEEGGFDRYNKDTNFITPKRTKAKKYALICRQNDQTMFKIQNDHLIEAVNNTNDIKVIVCTDIAKEGLDFKNVRQIHILEPWYNESKLTQIIGRGVRMFSHKSLATHLQNVTIFKHCVVHKRKSGEKLHETYDYKNYKLSQQSASAIREVEDVLKSNSIDCHLNRAHNTSNKKIMDQISMLGDKVKVAITPETGKCYKPTKGARDLVLIEHDVQTVASRIVNFFMRNKQLHVSKNALKEQLRYQHDTESDLFDLALSKIISRKRVFHIPDFGEGRLEESRGHLIFLASDIDFPVVSKVQLALYKKYKKGKLSSIAPKKTVAITNERDPPAKIDNISNIVKSKIEKLMKILDIFINNVKQEIVYSMTFHALSARESEAFIEFVLDDENIEDPIVVAASGDMLLDHNDKKYAVDIPHEEYKYKDKDGIQTVKLISDLKKIIENKHKRLPTYYRKFDAKKNDTALYVLDTNGKKPRNATSNTSGSVNGLIKAALKLKDSSQDIFKDEFDVDNINDEKVVQKIREAGAPIKEILADVLEYASRHYGFYTHPMAAVKE